MIYLNEDGSKQECREILSKYMSLSSGLRVIENNTEIIHPRANHSNDLKLCVIPYAFPPRDLKYAMTMRLPIHTRLLCDAHLENMCLQSYKWPPQNERNESPPRGFYCLSGLNYSSSNKACLTKILQKSMGVGGQGLIKIRTQAWRT